MSFEETLITRPPTKKFPVSLRMLVILFAVIYGVYICSLICLNQKSNVHTSTKFVNVEINPKPTSFNRQSLQYFCLNQGFNFFVDTNDKLSFVIYGGRSESGCKPERLFAILSMQRSGSRWLETLLNNHTNVSSNGEIFYAEETRSNVSSVLATLDRVYNLELLPKNQCCAAVGFKWMLNQGLMEYHNEIREYFKNRGISVIFLFRRNLLRRMVSLLANSYDSYAKLLNGTHKAHVQSHQEAAILSSYKPVINSTTLVMELKLMEKMIQDAFDYFNSTRHIILYYEDLITNRTKLMDVQEFLGLPKMKLSSRNVKIHKGSLSEHIKNWDDVDKILRGTSYESFLYIDYTN